VPVSLGRSASVGKAVPLFEAHTLDGPTAALGTRAQYAPSADGSRFLVNLEQERRGTRFYTILNWTRLVDGR
jgi:hypothetical protein